MKWNSNNDSFEQELSDGRLVISLAHCEQMHSAQLSRRVEVAGLHIEQVFTFTKATELREFIDTDEFLADYPDIFNAVWRKAASIFNTSHETHTLRYR